MHCSQKNAKMKQHYYEIRRIIMSTPINILLIVLAVIVIALIVLYFLGRKAQEKQVLQREQMEAAKQVVSMLIIDKKKMRITESGLPQMVIDQTPKLMRRSKLPIVKAKIGPKVMTLVCEASIFDSIPLKKEVKATVSGIYITSVKGVRGPLETVTVKKGFFARMRDKAAAAQNKMDK